MDRMCKKLHVLKEVSMEGHLIRQKWKRMTYLCRLRVTGAGREEMILTTSSTVLEESSVLFAKLKPQEELVS